MIKEIKDSITYLGKPDKFYSDGGRQYTGNEVKQFLEENEIKQETSAPYHPQGNMHAESAVKQAKQALAGWEKIRGLDKHIREKWIREKTVKKNNKNQSIVNRSASEMMLGRQQWEGECYEDEYYRLKPGRMLLENNIKEKKEKGETARAKTHLKAKRNKKEDIKEGDKVVVRTEKQAGKNKYTRNAIVTATTEHGNIELEMEDTGDLTSRNQNDVTKDNRTTTKQETRDAETQNIEKDQQEKKQERSQRARKQTKRYGHA